MPAKTCLEFGSVWNLASQGVCPALVLTTTTPDVRLPYSTEGIPRITSIDSIFPALTVRRSTPLPAVVCSLIPSLCMPELAPNLLGDTTCRFDSLLKGVPSTTTKVPKALLSSSSISRMCACPRLFKFGFSIRLPGTSCNKSFRLLGCTWRMASSPISDLEPICSCRAVTVTFLRLRLSSLSVTSNLVFEDWICTVPVTVS